MNDGGALGVILARAGSKGLPNKNSMTIAGKPMLAWTIEHALLSKKIKRVLVTTDGEALAQIAGKYDVEVIRRPAEILERFEIEPIATIPYMESRGERVWRRTGMVLTTLAVMIGVPAGLWYVDTYYLPLELIVQKGLDQLGLG